MPTSHIIITVLFLLHWLLQILVSNCSQKLASVVHFIKTESFFPVVLRHNWQNCQIFKVHNGMICYIHCERISPLKSINTSITTHIYPFSFFLFFWGVRTLQFYSLSRFQLYNTVLYVIVTMICIRCVRGTTDWNHLPWPGRIVTSCLSYLTTGGPGKQRGTNRLPPTGSIQERSKGERRHQSMRPANLPESSSLASILADQCSCHQERI